VETLKDLLKSQGKRIEIADDIEALNALVTIREHWEQLRSAVGAQDIDGVITFIETLIKNPDDGPLVDALDALGLPGEKLRDTLTKLGDTFQRIDRKYLTLLKPVVTFDEDAEHKDIGLLEWPLIGLKKTGASEGAANKPTYAFDLGASAKLELEAGDTWPGTETQVADPLLRIGIGGSFEFGAKARIPFSAGALGIGAEASREAFLDYYFDARADDEGLFAPAVVRRLDSLPNPLSLDSVWKAFESSDIVGAVLETEGKSAFSVDVSLADAFAFKHDIKMNVGLTFKANVRRRSTFMLRLRKIANASDGSFSVEATLERLQAKARARATEFGVDVDLSSLGKRLAKILEEHEGKLHELLEEYGDYLEPGTYLRQEALKSLRTKFIKDFTKDADLQAALEDVAEHALGFDSGAADGGLEKLVEDKIVELLDGADGAITGEIDEVANKLGAAFVEKLGFAPSLLSTVVDKVRSLVEGIRDDLEERVTALSAAKLDALIKKADAAGATIAAAGNKADKALSGVRDVIGKYEKTVAMLKARVSDAAQMKITAKISAEKSSRQERAVDAKVIFLRPSESAQKIYGDIVRGDFDALVALMRAPSSDAAVVESETTLSELKTTTRRLGFAAVLVGFKLGGASIFDTKSEVVIEGGRVSVITQGEFTNRRTKPHEEREVSFVDAYELSAAEETREFDIALEISHEDEKLKRREVEKVIRGFESAALLPIGTTDRAIDTFNRWIGPGEKKRIPADIKFALRLGAKHLERVMCLDRRDGTSLSPATQREIFDKVIDELVQSGCHEADHVSRVAKAVHEARGRGEPMPPPKELLFNYTPKLHTQLEGAVSNQHTKMRLGGAGDLHTRCMSLVNALDTMGDIYTAVPKIGDGEGWDVQQYEAAQQALNENLKNWLKAGWRDEVRPRTIAFVGTLIALAKMDDEADSGFLTLTMTKRGEDPETVVLTPT
jgi:hypothetical protein